MPKKKIQRWKFLERWRDFKRNLRGKIMTSLTKELRRHTRRSEGRNPRAVELRENSPRKTVAIVRKWQLRRSQFQWMEREWRENNVGRSRVKGQRRSFNQTLEMVRGAHPVKNRWMTSEWRRTRIKKRQQWNLFRWMAREWRRILRVIRMTRRQRWHRVQSSLIEPYMAEPARLDLSAERAGPRDTSDVVQLPPATLHQLYNPVAQRF